MCAIFQLSIDLSNVFLFPFPRITSHALIVIVLQRLLYGSAPLGTTLLGDDEELEEALALAS